MSGFYRALRINYSIHIWIQFVDQIAIKPQRCDVRFSSVEYRIITDWQNPTQCGMAGFIDYRIRNSNQPYAVHIDLVQQLWWHACATFVCVMHERVEMTFDWPPTTLTQHNLNLNNAKAIQCVCCRRVEHAMRKIFGGHIFDRRDCLSSIGRQPASEPASCAIFFFVKNTNIFAIIHIVHE